MELVVKIWQIKSFKKKSCQIMVIFFTKFFGHVELILLRLKKVKIFMKEILCLNMLFLIFFVVYT
jgi:hypothetical protein